MGLLDRYMPWKNEGKGKDGKGGSGGEKSSDRPPIKTSPIKQGGNTDDPATPSSFKRGGMVRKSGKARVHKGERVLTKRQNRKYESGKRG